MVLYYSGVLRLPRSSLQSTLSRHGRLLKRLRFPLPTPSRLKMNPLANLALSVGETLVHEAGRLLFGVALGRAKELLSTPQQLGPRELALNRSL